MSQKKYILISIKPQYAKLIREGKKTVELRRIAPKAASGDILVIYESAPISKVTSYAEIETIIQLELRELWDNVASSAMLKRVDFDNYFSGKQIGTGIKLKNIVELAIPQSLKIFPGFSAPQNFKYLSEHNFYQLCM